MNDRSGPHAIRNSLRGGLCRGLLHAGDKQQGAAGEREGIRQPGYTEQSLLVLDVQGLGFRTPALQAKKACRTLYRGIQQRVPLFSPRLPSQPRHADAPSYLETKRLTSGPTDILITRRHAPPYLEMRRQTRGPTDILITRRHAPPYLEMRRQTSGPTDILITRRHAPPYLEMRRQTRGPTDIFITRHPCTPPPGDEAPDQRPY